MSEKRAKYHKICFHKYFIKKNFSSEESSQKVEHSNLFTVVRRFCEVSQNMLLQVLYEK